MTAADLRRSSRRPRAARWSIARVSPGAVARRLVALAALVSGPALAQSGASCGRLADVEDAYFDARFEEATRLIGPCLDDADAGVEARERAYALLGNVRLSLQDEAGAREAIEALLRLRPDYRPDPDRQRPTFVALVEDVRGQVGRTPEVLDVPGPLDLVVGAEPVRVPLASYVRDPDGTALVYSAASRDEAVAEAQVDGRYLVVRPVGTGETVVAVEAQDASGLSAGFEVAVAVGRARESRERPFLVAGAAALVVVVALLLNASD